MDSGEIKTFITNNLYHSYDSSLSGLSLVQVWVHLVCHIIFAIHVVFVIILGFRRIRRFNKIVQQLYADTENREIKAIPTILILFIVTSLLSTIVNLIGKQMFVDNIILALPSVAFSALIFALCHGTMTQLPGTMIFGIIAGWLCWSTKSLLPSMILHIVNNSTASFLITFSSNPNENPSTQICWLLLIVFLPTLLIGLRWFQQKRYLSKFSE
jgi:hypothetical protein